MILGLNHCQTTVVEWAKKGAIENHTRITQVKTKERSKRFENNNRGFSIRISRLIEARIFDSGDLVNDPDKLSGVAIPVEVNSIFGNLHARGQLDLGNEFRW